MKNIFKKAFTLSEVLLVIGVIGIIAALTLPTLISTTGEKEMEALKKKAEYILDSAHQEVLTKEGYIDTQFWKSNYSYYPNKLKKYLRVSADCGTTATPGRCFPSATATLSNGSNLTFDTTYYKLKLNNGMILYITPYKPSLPCSGLATCGFIFVDLDGSGKGDNIINDDIYAFSYNTKKVTLIDGDISFKKFTLNSCTNKVQTAEIIRDLTGLGLLEAKALVDNIPSVIFDKVLSVEADQMKSSLEAIGATVTLSDAD